MITFNNWMQLQEGKSNKKPKPVAQQEKTQKNIITIKIDQTNIPTGHKPHMSGAGMHGERPKPRKKNWKDQME